MGEPKPPFPQQHQESPGLESELEPKPRYAAAQHKAEGVRWLLAPGDLADAKYCSELIETTVREFGGLDKLVSNTAHQTSEGSLAERR